MHHQHPGHQSPQDEMVGETSGPGLEEKGLISPSTSIQSRPRAAMQHPSSWKAKVTLCSLVRVALQMEFLEDDRHLGGT